MASILCIDYDFQFCRNMRELLSAREHTVQTCECPADAFALLSNNDKVDLIVSELYLPFKVGCPDIEKNTSFEVGVKTVRELSWALPDCKVVGMSIASPANLARIAQFLPTVPVVSKPSTYKEAADMIESFLTDDKISAVH